MSSKDKSPILVTGAAGRVGSIGRMVVELLRKQNLPVRALVRTEDERAQYLRDLGAEVVLGDLTKPEDVVPALSGCKRVYFGMSVSPTYIQAATVMAAAALEQGDIEVLVNMSQMTVSQMELTKLTSSEQQRQHWLSEQILNWSHLPVVHVRPTVFLSHPFFSTWVAESVAKDGAFRFPLGMAKTSPIAGEDVAKVIAAILQNPTKHIGKVYDLTGPRSLTGDELAQEFSVGLHHAVKFEDVDMDKWIEEMQGRGMPEHLYNHLVTMSQLHHDHRYDREADGVAAVTGQGPMSVAEFASLHAHDIYQVR